MVKVEFWFSWTTGRQDFRTYIGPVRGSSKQWSMWTRPNKETSNISIRKLKAVMKFQPKIFTRSWENAKNSIREKNEKNFFWIFWPEKFYHPRWGDSQWAKMKKKFFLRFLASEWLNSQNKKHKIEKKFFFWFLPIRSHPSGGDKIFWVKKFKKIFWIFSTNWVILMPKIEIFFLIFVHWGSPQRGW